MVEANDTGDCIDIREAVYLRMAPDDVRMDLKLSGSMTDEAEAKIFQRLFPSMREEALFWYQAGRGRGVVLCAGRSVVYVPESRLQERLGTMGDECLSKARADIASYDPLREAVIVVVGRGFSGVVVTGPGTPDPIRQLLR